MPTKAPGPTFTPTPIWTSGSSKSESTMSLSPGRNGPNKPAILCLHGSGTNSTIFNIQTIRLQRSLSSSFDFIFLDAPFEAPPGPGVVPVFDGCGPFYRWTVPGSEDMPPETRDLIASALSRSDKNIVGILGFSQGAKLAAGVCLEQQISAAKTAVAKGGGSLRFGVFLNGTSPPITSLLSAEEKGTLIRIPSVHVIGLQDEWREESEKLWAGSFQRSTARKLEFDVGHRLPTAEGDTALIVGEISRLYHETNGKQRYY